MKAQGVGRDQLPFQTKFQPYLAYAALFFFAIIIVFNGYEVFTNGNWSTEDFITAYIGIPIYFTLYLFWKIFKRTKPVKPEEADIWTGKAAIDAVVWPEEVPKNVIEKIWFWIA